MYTSLPFYYPSTLNPSLDTPTSPNVHLQLQQLTNWLTHEHLQHHQWVGIITCEYENSTLYEVKTVVQQQIPTSSIEPFYVNFTPVNVLSSKLFHSQLTLSQTRSMFPALEKDFLRSEGFHPVEWSSLNVVRSWSFEANLKPLLARFLAWFQYSKIYLSFYVRKVCLQENGQLSETFSNRLMYQWLKGQPIAFQTKRFSQPFVCPTQADVHCHLNLVKERLKRLKAVSQSRLIDELNPMFEHWVSAWELSVGWRTLSYCDDRLRRLLQRWAKRRHSNKGWSWVCHKYWRVGATATKCVFWLHLLTNSSSLQKFGTAWLPDVPSQLVNLLQAKLKECIDLESSSLSQWQFVCLDSNAILLTYTAFTLKKWRKNRSFYDFLLY